MTLEWGPDDGELTLDVIPPAPIPLPYTNIQFMTFKAVGVTASTLNEATVTVNSDPRTMQSASVAVRILPAAGPCEGNLVVNGGFDAGLTGWNTGGGVCVSGGSALVGILPGEPDVLRGDSLSQVVDIPADAHGAYLGFTYEVASLDPDVAVNGFIAQVQSLTDPASSDVIAPPTISSGGAQSAGLDLTPYIGHQISILFFVFNDGSGVGPVWAYVDDVVICTSYCGPPLNLPSPRGSDICWKAPYPDYAPNGVPDFDQRPALPGLPAITADGPAAAANSPWWYDSQFEPANAPPPTVSDGYPLVQAYGAWDDHDPHNVRPLIGELAERLNTDGLREYAGGWVGTRPNDMLVGLRGYLESKQLSDEYTLTLYEAPSFEEVSERVLRSEDVLLLVGLWENQTEGWRRIGGHWVTAVGVDCLLSGHIAIADPFLDGAERGRPGRHPPTAGHTYPHEATLHDDAAYISHDIYAVWQSSTVEAGARWGLVDYIRAEPDTESGDRSVAVPDPSAFLGANVPTSFAAQQAEGYEGGPIRAGVEYAVAIWRLGETATLSLAPQHVDALQDEVFGLDLVIESGARPIDSVQAYIDYDPAILQCVTESGQPATALAAGELTMVLQNEIDAAAGEINFAARTPLGQPGRAGRLQVARLFFRTIGVTHPISGTQVEFSWYPPRRTDAFSGVDSVLGQVREATVRSVVPATLRGHVTLQGRPVPPHNRWRIPLMLQLLDPAFGASVQTLAVTTDRTGTFTETVAAGNYTLRVKGMHTLANVRTGVALPPAPANVDLGTLREGDVDNDNDVDAADASLINVAFASVPGSLNWDARADLNEDGVVDATDMALISANYGQSGDVPVGAGLARTGAVTGPVTRSEVKVTPPVAVVFRPSSMDMDPGDEVMIDLVLQAGSAHVDAIDLHILYPTDLVQAINAGGSPATALISTGVLAVEFANSIDSSTGTMHFAGATVGDSLSGEVVLASIRFRARQRVAVGWLRLSMWQPESGVYYQGQPVLGAWPAARVHVMGSERLDLPLIRRR